MLDRDSLTLEGLGNGGALEMFQASLQRALDNIQDPNTEPDATRKITLTVEIKPTKNRLGGQLKYYVRETLAGAQPQETTVLMGIENGVAVAAEFNGDPRQMTIDDAIDQGKIMPIKKEGTRD